MALFHGITSCAPTDAFAQPAAPRQRWQGTAGKTAAASLEEASSPEHGPASHCQHRSAAALSCMLPLLDVLPSWFLPCVRSSSRFAVSRSLPCSLSPLALADSTPPC